MNIHSPVLLKRGTHCIRFFIDYSNASVAIIVSNSFTTNKKDFNMKTSKPATLLPEYDFSRGTRGKFARQFARGTNIIVLDPDLARHFPTARKVNQSLRSLLPASKRASRSALP